MKMPPTTKLGVYCSVLGVSHPVGRAVAPVWMARVSLSSHLRGSAVVMAILCHGCWSPTSHDLAINAELNAKTITAGEPIWIRFQLFNGTEQAVEVGVDVNDEEPKELSVRINDSAGRRVGPPAHYRMSLWRSEVVEPGESFERGVLLNRRFRLAEPGEYVVRVRYPNPLRLPTDERLLRPEEFNLKLRITPQDKTRLKSVAAQLAATACADGAEPATARVAARALGTIDGPIARPFLERLLDCGDFLVRLEGVAGLQREGSPTAVEKLIAAAEAPDEDRAGIARGGLEDLLRGPRSRELSPELVARARAAVGKERIR